MNLHVLSTIPKDLENQEADAAALSGPRTALTAPTAYTFSGLDTVRAIDITITAGKTHVVIKADGTIEYGEGYTPDDAARAFWGGVGRYHPATINAEMLALLIRYRNETPLGNQPHMIAHEATAIINKATGAA